jgi:glycosyltransferase involved in cell wall biosynthesis
MPDISLCIPTMNRFEFLKDSIPKYLDNKYITEIVICDETGEDYKCITATFSHPKLRVYKNEKRIGCLRNKLNVMSKATCEYICLIDSDNFVAENYFEAFNQSVDTFDIFLPDKALPNFIFTPFVHVDIHKDTLGEILRRHGNLALNLLNTLNCIFTKDMSDKLQSILNDNDVDNCYAGDAMYILTYAMCIYDAKISVVSNMSYEHRVHDGSYWMETEQLSMSFLNHLKVRFNLHS